MTTMTGVSILDFATAKAEETESSPAPDRMISGTPMQRVRNVFSDPSGQFFAGTWRSTTGRWKVRYTENEFCHVLAGVIRITDEEGQVSTFGPGASFVVPAGFAGIWEVIEPATKLYAVFKAANSAP